MPMLNIPVKPLYKALKWDNGAAKTTAQRNLVYTLGPSMRETVAERVNSWRGGATRRLVQLVDDIHQTLVHWAAVPLTLRHQCYSVLPRCPLADIGSIKRETQRGVQTVCQLIRKKAN